MGVTIHKSPTADRPDLYLELSSSFVTFLKTENEGGQRENGAGSQRLLQEVRVEVHRAVDEASRALQDKRKPRVPFGKRGHNADLLDGTSPQFLSLSLSYFLISFIADSFAATSSRGQVWIVLFRVLSFELVWAHVPHTFHFFCLA